MRLKNESVESMETSHLLAVNIGNYNIGRHISPPGIFGNGLIIFRTARKPQDQGHNGQNKEKIGLHNLYYTASGVNYH